ncbi:MAG: DUF436 domain-containing protein [Oscillibacter sp.]
MGVYAAQCCEHLNRALIVEHEAVPNGEIVNVLPQPKAGSSFATAAYKAFRHPVALEEIHADAGLDIGGTLIGMHLKKVAVPVRLKQNRIGQAIVLAARTRPKFIGGERAIYDESPSETVIRFHRLNQHRNRKSAMPDLGIALFVGSYQIFQARKP